MSTSSNKQSDIGINFRSDKTRRNRAVHVVDVQQYYQAERNVLCTYCNMNNHNISVCFKFKRLNLFERREWVKNNGLCFKCFGHHNASSCTKNVPCDKCGHIGHHRLVCSTGQNSVQKQTRQHMPNTSFASRSNGGGDGRSNASANRRSADRNRPVNRSSDRIYNEDARQCNCSRTERYTRRQSSVSPINNRPINNNSA